MHAVCSGSVNTPNKTISCLQACGRHGSLFSKEGFEFLSLSFSTGPPEWWPPHFNKPFQRSQLPFSTASAVSPYSPSSSIPQPGSPTCMCPARRCLLDWAFRGGSVSPWQLLAPCASPVSGWPTARRPLLHIPRSTPLRTLPYIGPITLGLGLKQ